MKVIINEKIFWNVDLDIQKITKIMGNLRSILAYISLSLLLDNPHKT